MRVDIVGAGPAGRQGLTLGGMQALEEAQLIIGAARVLQELALETAARQVALVSPSDIAEVLAGQAQAGVERAAVAVSGDVGLYSLAAPLRTALANMPNIELREHPGVSSLQCLCARLHMPWQDVHVLSAHGRVCDVAGAAQCHRLTFALTGGTIRAHNVCADLLARKPESERFWYAGHHTPSLYAGFPHLYLPGSIDVARRFVHACAAWGAQRKDATCTCTL